MNKLLFVFLAPFLGSCSDLALMAANTLARIGDYNLTANQAYGTHPLNKLDIYRPEEEAKGTVIFFYGGCWGACATYTREDYRFVAQALTSRGYVVVIPDYRRYPEVLFPQIMEDGAAAVAWVSNNVALSGGQADQIFLMGHSAGGHIAAMLAVNERYLGMELHKDIRGFIGLAAPYDFIFDKPYLSKVFAGLDYPESQPSYFIDGREPPLLLLYGDEDKEVHHRNIANMTKIVEKHGGEVVPHIYSGVDHIAILAALSIPYRSRFEIMNDIASFLREHNNVSAPINLGEKKMRKLRNGLVPLALAACSTCVQADEVEKAVDYRQGVMNVYAYNVTSMGDMVKGKAEFDVTRFARHAKDLAAAVQLDVLAGFPEDSINDESDASDTVWLDWEKFQEKHKALQEQAGTLAEVAAGGDEAAMKEQFGKTAKTCKGCHDDFKN